MRFPIVLVMTFATASTGAADVSFEEEIVNSGLGPKKTGARTTTSHVFIKGERQHVRQRIETSAKQAKILASQGQPLNGSTILQLDSANLFRIDLGKQTYTHRRLPAAKAVAGSPAGEAKKAADDPTRETSFRTKRLPETKCIEGLLCHRVAAEMSVRHFHPGTRQVRRQNRYLYQAWVADDFPGYEEIERFRQTQARKTTHPSLIGGGIAEQIRQFEDHERLSEEIKAIEGFPMMSVLKAYTTGGAGEEKQVFQLSRTVKSLSHSALPDSLFVVSKNLRRERY